jgi:hypothetical protein
MGETFDLQAAARGAALLLDERRMPILAVVLARYCQEHGITQEELMRQLSISIEGLRRLALIRVDPVRLAAVLGEHHDDSV